MVGVLHCVRRGGGGEGERGRGKGDFDLHVDSVRLVMQCMSIVHTCQVMQLMAGCCYW